MFQYEREDRELNDMILSGRAMEAFEKYYADGVVMQENNDPPTVGKDANRERELGVFAYIEKFNGASLLHRGAGGDASLSEWLYDYVLKSGVHVKSTQVARRLWKDGLVVEERFFYGK